MKSDICCDSVSAVGTQGGKTLWSQEKQSHEANRHFIKKKVSFIHRLIYLWILYVVFYKSSLKEDFGGI